MSKPYLLVSDLHCHNWTLFAKTNADGVNSRLRTTLNELLRAADTLVAAGGNLMVVAGDILHTRGQIDPEVLNPLRQTFDAILAKGVDIIAIPGNHDLKSAETMELASSIQNLGQISPSGGTCLLYNQPTIFRDPDHCIGMVPWRNTRAQLLDDLKTLATDPEASQMDVIIHAGIDGVLSGMPAHGLTSAMLADYGFRRVFAGHYHNHTDFKNGVISVGATAHQNWGDIGTRAGFLMVDDTSVTFHDSEAPKFVDISGLEEDEILLAAVGNYVRVRGAAMTQEDVNELRKELHAMGALGVSIEVPRTSAVTRTTAPSKGLTLEQSIEGFLDSNPPQVCDKAAVLARSLEVLHLSQAVAD